MAIVAVIVLIILCMLIILGAGLNAILFFLGPFAATSPAATTVQPYVPVTPRPVMAVVVGVELDATVKLSNRAFVPAYNNDLSPQYQELSQTFTNTMDAVFLNSDLSDIYNGTVVNGFTQGSVIVNFTINLIRAPTAPTVTGSTTLSSGVGSIDDQINSVRGQVEVSIKEIIQIADDNGDLTTLGVDSTTLSVTDVFVDVETTAVTETPATTIAPSTKTPDEEPPVLVCPDDVTAETEAGAAFGIISWTSPTATDNSGEVTVETDFVPGQLPIGSRNITVTATDASGNTAECVIVATVVDIEAPIAICPVDITRNTDLGQAYATISWSSPRGTDNSGTISSINADPREGQFAIGSHVITVTVVDPAGLEGQCTFDIVVQDNEAPTLECPATIEVSTDVGSPSSIVTWTVLGQDNSGSVSSLSSSPSSGESFAISTTTVVVTALDQSGNMGQCSFNVIVFDSELPVITCPASIIQATDLGSSSATVMWQVTAADNSGDPPTITSSPEPGMLSFGTLTVVAMAIDSSENTASCSFTVQIVDEEAPSITCPDNITVATDLGASSAIITWAGPFASDNTGQATAVTDISLGLWPIGIQTVTGTAVDGSGNEAQCTFWVNVQDLENPMVLCPADITSELVPDPVTWDATATDNSEMIANLTSSPSTSDVVLGTNTVTVIAMDPSGNKAECSFVVILTDTTAPTIICPDEVSSTLAAGQSSVTLAWVEPSATDLSGDVTVTASHSPGDYSIGQVNVTASATDSSGNQASCFFLVTVTDMQDPMISSCPPSQSVNTDNGLATAVVSWTPPTASDNSGSVSLTSDYSSGDPFPIGSTRVTYTATDGSGNSVMTCTFDIAVHDNEKPVISGCPSDQNVTTDFGNATAVVTWTPPTPTDNSGNQTLTSTDNPGDYFPTGNNTVTYYASDDAGNTETCTFFVVVSDNEKPVISGCQSDQNVTTNFGNATAVVTWTPPTATDNSGNQTLTSSHNPGDYFPIGNNTVTYTSTDGAGNTETCTFNLVVTDPMVNISLLVNEMYNLTSPGYPSNYDINLNLQWTVLAPSDYRVMISVTDFRSEDLYDYLHIGGGLTFDPDTWMVRFSGTHDSHTEVLLPGREAWILFFSDYITTNVGFVLEITTSSEAAGECGASFISCLKRDVCISNSTSCDGSPICFNGYDEWNCDPSCPSSDIQTISTSMPYSVISDNYPLAYGNDIECIWVLQAEAYHSLVIDILNFYLEDGYDFFYIGIGHDRSERGSLVVRLTGYIASTRYYLGIESYLYFYTDYSIGYSGFVLNVTSIPFELTESCDADQRVPVGSACDGVTDCVDDSDEFGCVCQDDQFQCNGICRPLSILCDGVIDCEGFSDEEDCPRCEPIKESSCLGLLPYYQTYYPSSLAAINQTLAIESFSVLSTAATTCHTDASLFLCAILFPECIHDGPTARPCQTTCEAVRSACSSAFESLTGSPWAIACEEEFSNASPLNDGSLADGLLCRGPEGDITNTMICGTRPVFNETVERIVGGEGSDLGEWPWIGSLSRGATNHQCGATVISREWAITAAHCVGAFDTITVGIISISNGNTSYQHTSSLEITSHPNFTSTSGGDDIAVLKLVDPIPAFSDFLRPACLATVGDEINNYKTCFIAGWGDTTEGGSISNDLQQAVVGLIPDEYCGSAYRSFRADSMICAGYHAGGVDTCQGDSGGPLMCEGEDGRWHLVGITSFGDGCARPNKPGIYTRVSQFIDFINSVVTALAA
ncbi:hyalin isoform X4 [Strongylocentrotus purpuratus]|uniref:Uncharacterized protein n=1 Tax=Strongylocentrotus purpuratus TaxID=7668 RepID=A0A7M7NNE5_STRPU|nr:hyalin isoform X4 [Strongylocentrotus purpuratus]